MTDWSLYVFILCAMPIGHGTLCQLPVRSILRANIRHCAPTCSSIYPAACGALCQPEPVLMGSMDSCACCCLPSSLLPSLSPPSPLLSSSSSSLPLLPRLAKRTR